MGTTKDTPEGSELKQRAEKQFEIDLDSTEAFSEMSPEEMSHLIHELQVHQIELKMQNDELRSTQDDLEKARDRYADLYDFAPIGYFLMNQKGVIDEANLTFASMLSVDRSALIGQPFTRVVLSDDQDIFYKHRQGLLEIETPPSCELRLVKKDGQEFYARLECTVITKEGDNDKQIRAAVNDVTEQKRAEKALRESEELHRITIENIQDPIFITDSIGNFTFICPNIPHILGYSVAEIQAMGNISALIGEGQSLFDFEDLNQLGEISNIETVIANKKGSKRNYLVNAKLVSIKGGTILYVFRDITERKQAEEERHTYLWFLESLAQVNRALQGTTDLEQMMKDVLDVVLSVFDCDRASLVYPCDPKAATWQAPMERIREPYKGVLALGLQVPMDDEVAWCHQLLRSSDGPVPFGLEYENQMPVGVGERFQIRSQLGMAIYPKDDKPWMFVIHQCSHSRFWQERDIRLFQEIGQRLAHVLNSLLMFRNLRESEEKYRQLFENSVVGKFVSNPAGRFLAVNPAFAQMLRYESPEELIASISDIATQSYLNPEDRVRYQQILKEQGHIENYEVQARCKDGSGLWVSNSTRTYFDQEGNVTHYEGVVLDITDRKRAEEALRESEGKYRSLTDDVLDSSAVGIFILDSDFRVVWVNHVLEDYFGLKRDEIIGKDKRQLIQERIKNIFENPDSFSNKVFNTYDDNTYVERFECHVLPNGEREERWLEHRSQPIQSGLYAGGRIEHYYEITERKQAEEERETLQKQFQQAQKMESIGRLAGGVAHDFNNMLSIIVGYAELALEKLKPSDSLQADLTEILTSAKRSADITRQLLAFARQQTVAPKVIDLNDVIGSMLKMLRRLIGEDIDLAWLPGAEVWSLKIDPSQIDQILANLCVNARDAISDVGKVTIEAKNIRFDQDYCADHAGFIPGEYVMLAVSDNGSGMAPETLDKIFEPFFTTKDLGKGTGLGLATVYGIVKQNNGFINVYSEPEKWTTFKIYLPRHTDPAHEMQHENTFEIPLGHSETILLAEDNRSILNLGKTMLEKLGYKVLTAITPGEALTLAKGHTGKIHLLITDVVMPEMNGRELSDQLKTLYPDLKTLFMSGYTADVIAHRGVLEEGVCFMPKPFSKKDMAVKVREALDNGNT